MAWHLFSVRARHDAVETRGKRAVTQDPGDRATGPGAWSTLEWSVNVQQTIARWIGRLSDLLTSRPPGRHSRTYLNRQGARV